MNDAWANHKVRNLPNGALSAICVDGRYPLNSTRFRHVFVYLLIIMAVIVILTWAIKPPSESQNVGISKVAEERPANVGSPTAPKTKALVLARGEDHLAIGAEDGGQEILAVTGENNSAAGREVPDTSRVVLARRYELPTIVAESSRNNQVCRAR